MINLDFWYCGCLEDVVKVTCSFSDCDCIYRGWMINAEGDIIGDYSTSDSLEIERTFNVHLQ